MKPLSSSSASHEYSNGHHKAASQDVVESSSPGEDAADAHLKYHIPPQYIEHSDADSEPFAASTEISSYSESERAEIEERIIAEAREVLSQQVIGEMPLVPPRAPWHQRFFASVARHHGVLLLLCALLLWGALSAHLPESDRNLRLGATATHDIVAPRATSLLDREATRTRREEAAALVTPEYDSDLSAQARAWSRLETSVLLARDESSRLQREIAASNVQLAPSALVPRESAASTRATPTSSTRFPTRSSSRRVANARLFTAQNDIIQKAATSKKILQAREDLTQRATVRLQSRLAARGLAVSSSQSRQMLKIADARWKVLEGAAREAVRTVYLDGGRVQQIRSDVEDDLTVAGARIKNALSRLSGRVMSSKASFSSGLVTGNAKSDTQSNRLPVAVTNRATSSTRTTQSRTTQFRTAQNSAALTSAEENIALVLAKIAARVPNLVVNEKRTERARLNAQRDVAPVLRNIAPGTILVAAGTVIDDEKWAQLQDLDLVATHFDWTTEAARLALCALVVVFGAAYVARFAPNFSTSTSSLWLLTLVPVATLLLCRVALRVPFGESMVLPIVACAAMTLTILLDARAGMLCALGVSILLGALTQRAGGDSMTFAIVALGSLIAVLAVGDVTSRMHLVKAGAIIALTHAVLHVVMNGRDVSFGLLSGAFSAAALGAAATIVAAGLAMFLERPLGITTHLSLLELSSPDEPVMRRMQSEAPGTYTHSLMVAQLAEAGAKAVRADPLICRVGGLYHDIGKLRRPHCFIENQSGINVHDRLSPQLSALLIVAHVKDGLTLARVLRLPRPVQEIITQHHGRSLVSYFYHRALQAVQNESSTRAPFVEESLFRYPGPRPQSKEAAVVMLADSVEASSRSIPDLTPEKLDAHIKHMVESRLREGELDDCELTLRDLSTIERAFAHVLRGALHQRIEYPDPTRDLNAVLRNTRRDDDWTRDASRSSQARHDSNERKSTRDQTKKDDTRRSDKGDKTTAKNSRKTASSTPDENANIEYSNGEYANGIRSDANSQNANSRPGVLRGGMLRETVRARSLRNVREATAAALSAHLQKNENAQNSNVQNATTSHLEPQKNGSENLNGHSVRLDAGKGVTNGASKKGEAASTRDVTPITIKTSIHTSPNRNIGDSTHEK